MDNKIGIFVSMHDDFYIPENRLLTPIQVGSSLSSKKFEDMLHDDVGENISDKNKMYCELTAQYWVWRNITDLEYYGFFHYRRYLSFNPVQLEHWENIVYFDYCDEDAVGKLMLKEQLMEKLIYQYDVILPQKNPIGGETVYEHWVNHLEKQDIDTLLEIIIEKYPDFYEVTKEIMNAKEAIHCNMFIMKKQIFQEYSEWLFDILAEHEKRSDYSNYTTEKYRTIGHLGERLCAIYCRYLELHGVNLCYLQRTLFRNTDKNKVINSISGKNFVPVLLACNNGYIRYTSVLVESILSHCTEENKYAIYILHTDISEENQAILQHQIGKCKNVSIEFINVKRRLNTYKNLYVDRHLSVETYFRFFAIDIFPNLEKMIYLDCDTIVCEDIAKLFHTDLKDKSIGAVRDADIISLYSENNTADPEVRENLNKRIKLQNYTDYFQAGVLLLNLKKIRMHYSMEEIFSTALERNWKFQDQDVLNYIFRGDVKYLDSSWNVLYDCFNRIERIVNYVPAEISQNYLESRKNPCIIHYAGMPKPWNDLNVDMASYYWTYAQNTPFYEELIHLMDMDIFKNALQKKCVGDEIDKVREELNYVSYCLQETRKSFSYRLGYMLTFLPRKYLGIINKRKKGNKNG